MTYDELRARTNTGWNTWFSSSMTSHVLLPYGFCIGLCFRSCSEGRVIRNLKPEMRLLAESSRNIILREWCEHGHVHENYSGIDGSGCGVENSCSFYHWGGLLGYIAIIQT